VWFVLVWYENVVWKDILVTHLGAVVEICTVRVMT